IAVTAESPAIDLESAEHQVTISGDTVKALPITHTYNALVILLPGVVTNSNDVVTATSTTSFPIHGGRTNEGRLMLDGLTVGSPPSGNSATSYFIDVASAQEVSFTTPAGLGEVETAGVVMNVISKSGGNSRHGSFYATGTGGRLQADNVTPMLRSQG